MSISTLTTSYFLGTWMKNYHGPVTLLLLCFYSIKPWFGLPWFCLLHLVWVPHSGDLRLHFHLTEAALESLAMVVPWGQVPIQASFQTQKVLGSFRWSLPAVNDSELEGDQKLWQCLLWIEPFWTCETGAFFSWFFSLLTLQEAALQMGIALRVGGKPYHLLTASEDRCPMQFGVGSVALSAAAVSPSSPSGFCLKGLPCSQLLQHHQRTFSATAFISQLLPNTIVKLLRDHNKFCSNCSETSGSGPGTWDVSAAH